MTLPLSPHRQFLEIDPEPVPERLWLARELERSYARAHASPFCGVACDVPMPPHIQARASAGRWQNQHSRSPFNSN